LLDRAIKARYPPGSTWKLAVAAMALKRGIVGPGSHMPIPCRGGLQYGNRYFRCWEARGHGNLTLTEAIAQSCDVYFYQLGIKLGVSSLLEDANSWGFRGRTGIDLPGEIPSEFPTGPEYYDRIYGPRRWTSAVALNLAIGQGENAQTLAQMVRFYQQLASDGRMRTPFVVHPLPAAVENTSLDLNGDQIATLRHAMISVVEQGTARGSRLGSITIAGKTGTAAKLVNGHYSHSDYNASFVGFIPSRDPAIAIVVVIDAPHGPNRYFGGTVSAPIFRRIAEPALQYLGVPPSLNPAPPVLVASRDDSATAPASVGEAPPPLVSLVADGEAGTVPDVRGLSAREAIRKLVKVGMAARASGDGFVVSQDPAPGSPLEAGGTCRLVLERAPARRGQSAEHP
jgi:penicillin-binding protein 2